ncbi:GGDEF domain-containing response regulator [Teredinibacter purpureus]|uniref:GGDEF domain-containing response regulator n=1 Tax=Teredinibacter purpureus TaxID=2731756 RepID=UPI0005F7D7AD|nr:GGDEF domain-containing response regulator [Teredinibacter purpureus]
MKTALAATATDFERSHESTYQHVFLMVEDNPADEALVKEMLSQAFDGKCHIVCVDRFEKITETLANGSFEVLILDMDLPDRSGVVNISELGLRFPDLPIVVLTGQDNFDVAVEALHNGAQDYLSKNDITPDMLSRSLYYARERKLIEQQLRHALEDSAYRNMQLEAQSKHDPLTGLPNRTYLHEAGNRVIFRAKRHKMSVALLFFDLNGFKKVNDSYGHLVGDELLKQLANRLEQEVRDSDLLARLGGDEFVVLTDLLHYDNEVYPLLTRLEQAFASPFVIEGSQLMMRTSIGVAFYPESDSLDLLLKNADFAMYEAKNATSSNVCFFTESMAEQFSRVHRIEQCLGKATSNAEFDVVFQPLLFTNNNSLSVEALVRWHSPELGSVPPDDFINLAERSPVINDITRLVVQKSATLLHHLNTLKKSIGTISINVCASQLEHPHFCDLFLHWLHEFRLPATKVCLELTERQIINKADDCKDQFDRLRREGITIALDDYGTGFSSLTHLLSLDIDLLKLDQFLIQQIDTQPRHQALVSGIVEMAKHMNIKVIAEGIEREEDLNVLTRIGVDGMQGFLIAKPLPLEDMVAFTQPHTLNV